MILDPTKTYLEWNGTTFPNSSTSQFKAPAGSTIDWGDGKVQTFDTEDTNITTHTYSDGKTTHTIIISGLTTISNHAFSDCHSLTSVTIGNSVTTIGNNAFYQCVGLTSIIIPNSVTSIGSYALAECNLTSITIPNSVISISVGAFSSCSSLTSITIPDSVTSIDDYAFYHCVGLTSIIIPNSVTSIGSYAFVFCSALKTIMLLPKTPPVLASTDAIPTTISTIYVPQSAKESYKIATNWANFADRIRGGDNLYLSFVIFNIKNKEYIDSKILETSEALKAENAKLKAQLDYLAMMTNVKLDG